MKILVCIKQVPDMESRFKPDAAGVWFAETDLAWRMNEYDEYAVEQAVRLKEQLGESPEITVLSIGPERVVEAVKKGLAMGCDRAVHVQDTAAATKDPWQIASIIAAYAKDKGFELIFTGMQSQDRGSAQVGVQVAEQLGIPSVTTIVGFAYDNGAMTVKRELEGGIKGGRQAEEPRVAHLPIGAQCPPLPDPSQHHEGQEKRDRGHTGGGAPQGRSPGADGRLLSAGKERWRARYRRGSGRPGRARDRHPQRKNSSAALGGNHENITYR